MIESNNQPPSRNRLSGGHRAIAIFWLVGWSLVILWWWDENNRSEPTGWLDGMEDAMAILGLIAGALVVGLSLAIARFLMRARVPRYLVLLALPAIFVVWILAMG